MEPPVCSRARFAALGEVFFVLIAANVIILLGRLAGFTPELLGVTDDLQLDARTGLVDGLFVFLKFAVMLLIGLTILKRFHGVNPSAVGFSRSGHSLPYLLMRGVALGAVAMLPWLALMSANAVLGFGEGVAGQREDHKVDAKGRLFDVAPTGNALAETEHGVGAHQGGPRQHGHGAEHNATNQEVAE